MKHICFELTMPNRGSWNGQWSGQDRRHFIFKSVSNSFFEANKDKLIGSWHHRWEDGWSANVAGKLITPEEKRKLSKVNAGFCGYGWMVESIMLVGGIYCERELRQMLSDSKGKEAV
jgi:hypothetical protein